MVQVPEDIKATVVARIIRGEYVEKGSNHDRPVFVKEQAARGPDVVDVILYYWDDRDGDQFEGWYFGNRLGGAKVWARAKERSLKPPARGWCIPWDGSTEPAVLVATPRFLREQAEQAALEGLRTEVAAAEGEAREVLSRVAKQPEAEGKSEVAPAALALAEKEFVAKIVLLGELQRKAFAVSQKATSTGGPAGVGPVARACQQLAGKAQAARSALSQELAGLKARRKKAEEEHNKAEEEQRKTLEAAGRRIADEEEASILEELQTKYAEQVNGVEILVSRAETAAKASQTSVGDNDAGMDAVETTEALLLEAKAGFIEAWGRLEAEAAKPSKSQAVKAERDKLWRLAEDLQARLEPLRDVRQAFEERIAARKVAQDVGENIAKSELESDQASELVKMAASGNADEDDLGEASRVTTMAEAHAKSAARIYETKLRGAAGVLREELSKLGPRVEAMTKQVHDVCGALKDIKEGRIAVVICTKVAEAMLLAEKNLETLQALVAAASAGEAAATEAALAAAEVQAQTACSSAKVLLQSKSLEAKRITGNAASSLSNDLSKQLRHLAAIAAGLDGLKAEMTARRRHSVLTETEQAVAAAEDLLARAREAAVSFTDDAQLEAATDDEVRTLGEAATAAEKEASLALQRLRIGFASTRQVLLRGGGASGAAAAVAALQSRIDALQTELERQRKATGTVAQRLALKHLISDLRAKLDDAEGDIETAVSLAARAQAACDGESSSTTDGVPSQDTACMEAEAAVQKAFSSSRGIGHIIEMRVKTAHAGKDILASLETRAQAVQKRADEAKQHLREVQERKHMKGLVAEAVEKSDACAAAMTKVEELERCETPSIIALQRAMQEVQVKGMQCRSFVAMKRLSLRHLAEAVRQDAMVNLDSIGKAAESTLVQLVEMRKKLQDLKAKTVA